ncbi:MAG: endo-1,4-beta-xylanase, partial [Methanomassiliicoccales archaeon]
LAFWHHDVPENISPEKVSDFFDHRINDIMPYLKALRGRNVEILLVNEPFWYYSGHYGWMESPFYKAYGQKWITEAFVRLYNAASSQGLEYGKDYHIMLINEYDIEIPSPKASFVMGNVAEIKKEIEARIGTPIDITIGLQFHVSTGAGGYIGPDPVWMMDERNLPVLREHFRKLSQMGRLSITELDFAGEIDLDAQSRILSNLIRAAIQSGVFNDITLFSPLRRNNPFKPNIFELDTYQPTANYYAILQALMVYSLYGS